MQRNLQSFLSSQATELLTVIETTNDEGVRLEAINSLALTHDVESSRALIEAFERTPWRSIRMSILRGLGATQQVRATEFLLRWASHTDDLPMAAAAIISLGATQDPAAGAFLQNILSDSQHPLRREAVIGLTKLELFPLYSFLYEVYQKLPEEGFTSLRQYLVIAAGISGASNFRDTVTSLLTDSSTGASSSISEGGQGMLFSASLLTAGRIGDHKTAALLREIDTSYRFFAEQLRSAALDSLSMRLQAGVEDAVNALIEADSLASIRQALNFLQSYSAAEAWEACELFENELSHEKRALARAFLPLSTRADLDFQFLLQNFNQLSRYARAALARALTFMASEKSLAEWLDKLPLTQLTQLADDVSHPRFLERLQKHLTLRASADSFDEAECINIVNTLARQAFMFQVTDGFRFEIGKSIHKLLMSEVSQKVKERCLRALGQIAWTDFSNMQNLVQQFLKTDEPMLAAIYAMLGHHRNQRWIPLIAKRLRTVGQRPEAKYEVGMALGVLADLEKQQGLVLQFELHPDHQQYFRSDILRVMAQHVIEGMDGVLEWGLASQDFQTLLLALAAMRNNGRDKFWPRVCALTKHSNACIRGRAVDSLCVAAGPMEHQFLVHELAANPNNEDFVQKVLRTMLPAGREGLNYEIVVQQIKKLLKDANGVFRLPDYKSAANHLIDRLAGFDLSQVYCDKSSGGRTLSHQLMPSNLDRELERELEGYKNYSEIVRSIIRNAELTYRNPELFDERVDKSTVVVEFVKSIDIYLQEKLGSPLFAQSSRDFLAQMQSLILKLDLDRDQLDGGAVILDLECADVFKQFDFPTHKLQSLCRSIMSGKIMHEQYRVIDGLRSWSLLLLLFGRAFKFRGQKIEAIFPIKNMNARAMVQLCYELNAMQELRNAAAHRATLLSASQIQEFRQHSLAILNQLSTVV